MQKDESMPNMLNRSSGGKKQKQNVCKLIRKAENRMCCRQTAERYMICRQLLTLIEVDDDDDDDIFGFRKLKFTKVYMQ